MAEFSSEKIRELLSDPKNIELIAGIAGGMSGGGLPLAGLLSNKESTSESRNPEPQAFTEKAAEQESTSQEPALDTMQSTQLTKETSSFDPGLFQSGFPGFKPNDSDRRIALLKAIKPYISDSKKERVDGLVRAISVAGILNNYKGGLFGNKM